MGILSMRGNGSDISARSKERFCVGGLFKGLIEGPVKRPYKV